MSLLLTVYNTSVWKTFVDASGLPLLNEAASGHQPDSGILYPIQSLPSVSILLSALQNEQSVWLAVVQAEYFMADALERGSTLQEAAQQWIEQTDALLDLQRKHRQKLRLFNIHQAVAQPARFITLLNSRIAIKEFPEQTANRNFLLLAACQYVNQQPPLKSLNARLQATVMPLCENEYLSLNIEQILLQQQSLNSATNERTKLESKLIQHQEQFETEIKTVTEERDLILNQLLELQEQFEALNKQYNLSLQSEQQQHRHSLLARDKQHAKEISKIEAELRKVKARAANAEYAGLLRQNELKKLQASISWKAAMPVRVIGRLLNKNAPTDEKLMQDVDLLLTSEYFDVDWYLQTYTDIAESLMNPAEHYLVYGAAEGRLPGPLFDGNWYLQHYPDVAEAEVNPLLHFILYGQQEGRSSSPILLTDSRQNEETNNG